MKLWKKNRKKKDKKWQNEMSKLNQCEVKIFSLKSKENVKTIIIYNIMNRIILKRV